MKQSENKFTCQCQCGGKKLLSAIKKPTVRQSLHYEFGVYKDTGALSPAMSFHLGGDHAIPLWRVILVLLAASLTLACVIKCKCCKKEKHSES